MTDLRNTIIRKEILKKWKFKENSRYGWKNASL